MSTETITSYYEKDHDRLDSFFKQFQALKNSNFDQAKANFKEFITGLKRHIIWEEEILFPFFEEKAGMKDSGPTVVMRTEHRQIHEALEAIHDKIRNRRTDSDPEEARLLAILSAHNLKEESILYPMIDKAATDQERVEIFKKMEEIPLNTGTCCGGHH
ncbi:MAG: hemerythrin domain-containing protein [Chlamydiota bacterium]|nr:hemerythrin domain-containing protein [Chlamydiota bacterium]